MYLKTLNKTNGEWDVARMHVMRPGIKGRNMKLTVKTSSHFTVIKNDKNLIMVQPTLAVASEVL